MKDTWLMTAPLPPGAGGWYLFIDEGNGWEDGTSSTTQLSKRCNKWMIPRKSASGAKFCSTFFLDGWNLLLDDDDKPLRKSYVIKTSGETM